MRKGTDKARNHTIANVSGYHRGGYENYLIFASDRPLQVTDDHYNTFIDGSPVQKALYGFEWETQNWGITDQKIYANVLRDIVFAPFHKDLWKIERDASLDDGNCDSSAENITQPMTKAYIRNHYRDFRYMWEKAEALGISCTETGKCGQHIHINNICFGRDKKTQDEAIKKFCYIVNKHYDFMIRLFHRNPNVTYYCPKMPSLTNKEFVKNMDLGSFYDDHHACINLGHYHHSHIELRIVGGQANYPCFRNTMESVFFLVDRCKTISWADADDIVKIFKGCNRYVFDRIKTYVLQSGKVTTEQVNSIRENVDMSEKFL